MMELEMNGDLGDVVYILVNEAMPGYAKVGRTNNLEQRLRSLDNTSTPLPFECFYAARVQDANFVEKQLHDAFDDNRVRSNREFFEIAPERIASALKIAELQDVTPNQDIVETEEDKKALDKARKIRSVFNFEMVQIHPGSVLTFSRNPDVTCSVLNSKKVAFEGEELSLSAAALIALEREGVSWSQVQGPRYWEFEGETLLERRLRMEQEG